MADQIDKVNLNGEIRDIADSTARAGNSLINVSLNNLQTEYDSLKSEIYDGSNSSRIERTEQLISAMVSSGINSSVFQQTDAGFSWTINNTKYSLSGYMSSSKGGVASVTLFKDGTEYTGGCYLDIYSVDTEGNISWYLSKTIADTSSFSWNYDLVDNSFLVRVYKDDNKTELYCAQTFSAGNTGNTGENGRDNLSVRVTSSNGNIFQGGNIATVLTCSVYLGTTDVTDKVTQFTWTKVNSNGEVDTTWSRITDINSINIYNYDVTKRASFNCEVTIDI